LSGRGTVWDGGVGTGATDALPDYLPAFVRILEGDEGYDIDGFRRKFGLVFHGEFTGITVAIEHVAVYNLHTHFVLDEEYPKPTTQDGPPFRGKAFHECIEIFVVHGFLGRLQYVLDGGVDGRGRAGGLGHDARRARQRYGTKPVLGLDAGWNEDCDKENKSLHECSFRSDAFFLLIEEMAF
jgi:hypothetical protein